MAYAVWVVNRVTHPGEATLRYCEQSDTIESARINDRFQVSLETTLVAHVDVTVGKARPASVVADQRVALAVPLDKRPPKRHLQLVLQVRKPPQHPHQGRPLPRDRVSDLNTVARSAVANV